MMDSTAFISETRFENFAERYVDCFMRLARDEFDAMLGDEEQLDKKITATVIRVLSDNERAEKTIVGRKEIINAYNIGYFDITSDCVLIEKHIKSRQNEVVIKCIAEETKQSQNMSGRYRIQTKIKLNLAEINKTEETDKSDLKITDIWQSTKLKKIADLI